MTGIALHLTPAPGRRVLDPATFKPLPPEGAAVHAGLLHGVYWMRRLADGDVTCTAGPVAASTPVQPAAEPAPERTAP